MPDISDSVDQLSRVRTHLLHTAIRVAYDGSNNPEYVGWAKPGSPTTVAVWRIAKIIGGANPTAVLWAEGNTQYDNIWDDHASLTYS